MYGNLNKTQLMGRLGADPEIRRTKDGSPIAHLRVATSEYWRDSSSGERKQRTEWHNVVIFIERLVKVAEDKLKKGSHVYLAGPLRTRKWQDQQGQDRYTTEIVLSGYGVEFEVLDKQVADDDDDQSLPDNPPSSSNYDDEIPF